MSRRTHVKTDNNVDVRYTTWVDMMIDMIEPKNLFFIGARGVGKTSSIVAKRSQKICKAMPGAYFAFLSDMSMRLTILCHHLLKVGNVWAGKKILIT